MSCFAFLSAFFVLLHLAAPGYAQPTTRPAVSVAEQRLQYTREILRQEFDFQLSPVGEGKFSLDIVTGSQGPVFIKVYDIIGNLLYEKSVRVRGTQQEEVDLSHLDLRFFVVKVGNEETHRTKRIVTL